MNNFSETQKDVIWGKKPTVAVSAKLLLLTSNPHTITVQCAGRAGKACVEDAITVEIHRTRFSVGLERLSGTP